MGRREFRRGAAAVHQRRLTQWLDVMPTRTSVSAAGSIILNSLTVAEKALRPFTVVRTRLLMSIVSDQTGLTETQYAAVGLAVVSDQAEAIGITAVPTPVTDLASDLWFLHQFLTNETVFSSAVGFSDDGAHQYQVDSKAMRKVQDGEDLVVVAEGSSIGTGGFILTVAGRLLIKLH